MKKCFKSNLYELLGFSKNEILKPINAFRNTFSMLIKNFAMYGTF